MITESVVLDCWTDVWGSGTVDPGVVTGGAGTTVCEFGSTGAGTIVCEFGTTGPGADGIVVTASGVV